MTTESRSSSTTSPLATRGGFAASKSAAPQNKRRSHRHKVAAGDHLDTAIIRITPRRIISFGIDDQDTEPHQLTADIRNV